MHKPVDAGDLLVLVLGIVAAVLLGTTLVLGLVGPPRRASGPA